MLLSHGEQLRLLLSRLMLPKVRSLLFPQLLRKPSISENYAMNSASLNRHHQFFMKTVKQQWLCPKKIVFGIALNTFCYAGHTSVSVNAQNLEIYKSCQSVVKS